MAARMYKRGNIIYWLKGKWSELEDDICTHCHHAPTKEGHDYCLRDLGIILQQLAVGMGMIVKHIYYLKMVEDSYWTNNWCIC